MWRCAYVCIHTSMHVLFYLCILFMQSTITHWFSVSCLFTIPICICKDRLKMLCARWGRLVCILRELRYKDLPSGSSRAIIKHVYSWRLTLFALKHSTPAKGAQDMFVGEWCAPTCLVVGDCEAPLCLGAMRLYFKRYRDLMLSGQPKDVTWEIL